MPLDPSQFSIAPDTMRSFQDRLLELRRTLPPQMQAMQPPLPGQPQQTQPEQRQQDLGAAINQAAQGIATQAATTPEGKVDKKAAQGVMDEMNGLLDQVNPFKPKPTYGSPEIGKFLTGENRGGILGTGILPIDVLAFALSQAVTWNMPQDQAIKTTFAITKMPSELRDAQLKHAQDFIASKMQVINAGTAVTNAETSAANAEIAKAKAGEAQKQYQSRLTLAEAFRRAGRPADALAMEADAVTDYTKLTGSTDHLPPNLQYIMSGVASGAIKNIPPSIMNILGAKSPEEAQGLAEAWLGAHLMTQPITPLPDVGAVMRTPSGPVVVERAPVQDNRSLQGIRSRVDQLRSGQPAQPAIPAPAPAQNVQPTPGIPAPVGVAPTPQATIPQPTQPVSPIDQLSQSNDRHDQWIAKYAGDIPQQTEAAMRPLFQRPMDAGQRQRLIAQHATLDYAKNLAQEYDAMVQSYGGDAKFTLKPRLTMYLMNLGTRISGEGVSGAALTMLSDAADYLAQEKGTKLTPEALKFLGTYAQAQKFARGAMNDAANLAVRERTYFNQMTGTPLNKPAVFRSKIRGFAENIAKEYNSALKSNKLFNTEGWEPFDASSLSAPSQQPQQAIPTPNGQLPAGWEVISPRVSGDY